MILNDEAPRKLGYVCTECGVVSNRLKTCPKGCSRICPECLAKLKRTFIFCKKCGNMTLDTYRGSV